MVAQGWPFLPVPGNASFGPFRSAAFLSVCRGRATKISFTSQNTLEMQLGFVVGVFFSKTPQPWGKFCLHLLLGCLKRQAGSRRCSKLI